MSETKTYFRIKIKGPYYYEGGYNVFNAIVRENEDSPSKGVPMRFHDKQYDEKDKNKKRLLPSYSNFIAYRNVVVNKTDFRTILVSYESYERKKVNKTTLINLLVKHTRGDTKDSIRVLKKMNFAGLSASDEEKKLVPSMGPIYEAIGNPRVQLTLIKLLDNHFLSDRFFLCWKYIRQDALLYKTEDELEQILAYVERRPGDMAFLSIMNSFLPNFMKGISDLSMEQTNEIMRGIWEKKERALSLDASKKALKKQKKSHSKQREEEEEEENGLENSEGTEHETEKGEDSETEFDRLPSLSSSMSLSLSPSPPLENSPFVKSSSPKPSSVSRSRSDTPSPSPMSLDKEEEEEEEEEKTSFAGFQTIERTTKENKKRKIESNPVQQQLTLLTQTDINLKKRIQTHFQSYGHTRMKITVKRQDLKLYLFQQKILEYVEDEENEDEVFICFREHYEATQDALNKLFLYLGRNKDDRLETNSMPWAESYDHVCNQMKTNDELVYGSDAQKFRFYIENADFFIVNHFGYNHLSFLQNLVAEEQERFESREIKSFDLFYDTAIEDKDEEDKDEEKGKEKEKRKESILNRNLYLFVPDVSCFDYYQSIFPGKVHTVANVISSSLFLSRKNEEEEEEEKDGSRNNEKQEEEEEDDIDYEDAILFFMDCHKWSERCLVDILIEVLDRANSKKNTIQNIVLFGDVHEAMPSPTVFTPTQFRCLSGVSSSSSSNAENKPPRRGVENGSIGSYGQPFLDFNAVCAKRSINRLFLRENKIELEDNEEEEEEKEEKRNQNKKHDRQNTSKTNKKRSIETKNTSKSSAPMNTSALVLTNRQFKYEVLYKYIIHESKNAFKNPNTLNSWLSDERRRETISNSNYFQILPDYDATMGLIRRAFEKNKKMYVYCDDRVTKQKMISELFRNSPTKSDAETFCKGDLIHIDPNDPVIYRIENFFESNLPVQFDYGIPSSNAMRNILSTVDRTRYFSNRHHEIKPAKSDKKSRGSKSKDSSSSSFSSSKKKSSHRNDNSETFFSVRPILSMLSDSLCQDVEICHDLTRFRNQIYISYKPVVQSETEKILESNPHEAKKIVFSRNTNLSHAFVFDSRTIHQFPLSSVGVIVLDSKSKTFNLSHLYSLIQKIKTFCFVLVLNPENTDLDSTRYKTQDKKGNTTSAKALYSGAKNDKTQKITGLIRTLLQNERFSKQTTLRYFLDKMDFVGNKHQRI